MQQINIFYCQDLVFELYLMCPCICIIDFNKDYNNNNNYNENNKYNNCVNNVIRPTDFLQIMSLN